MNKFEYDSFYKFVVSLGISLITLSAFLGWTWFKEPYDLLIEDSKIEHLTPVAQNTIKYRQEFMNEFLPYLPRVILFFLVLGILISIIGMIFWYSRQKVLDKRQDMENQKLESELLLIPDEKIIKNAVESVTEDIDSNKGYGRKTDFERAYSLIAKYLKIENLVSRKLESVYSSTHIMFRNRRIDEFEYDIILNSLGLLDKDYIIDVKYTQSIITYNWLEKKIEDHRLASIAYQNSINSIPKRVIIIVNSGNKIEKSKKSIQKYKDNYRKSKEKIILLSEEELNDLDTKIKL